METSESQSVSAGIRVVINKVAKGPYTLVILGSNRCPIFCQCLFLLTFVDSPLLWVSDEELNPFLA
jgi:hypothetical protein